MKRTTVLGIEYRNGAYRGTSEYELTFDGRVVHLMGGPTGYESAEMESMRKSLDRLFAEGWLANAGGSGYPSLMISGDEMRKAMIAFGEVAE